MADIFISYARATAPQASAAAEALRAAGYSVWIDEDLPAHRPFAREIEAHLDAAKAALVIWSADAVESEWVLSEANRARADQKLVQVRVDDARLPMPFDQIQCANIADWTGDTAHAGWRKVIRSIADLAGAGAPTRSEASSPPLRDKPSICVLPFANMSDDPQQEYFSDGISEDIITDLSKVSALFVVARDTAFTFKSKSIETPTLARQLSVSHVLAGSVRKAGSRVRITAQLTDGATGGQVWAERYDRDLEDIFALQDEVSQAIVGALQLKLLPEEKKAIERRGTDDVEAYGLYLMARHLLVSGNRGDMRAGEAIVRLCQRATEIDPGYARAWALMAHAQTSLRFVHGRPDDGLAAAEQALALDAGLAEAHAVRAKHLYRLGRHDESSAEIATALRLDPESYEVNESAGLLCLRERRFADAIVYYEKAAALAESSVGAAAMLTSSYEAIDDPEGVRRSARTTLARADEALARDQSNGTVMGFRVSALAALGKAEQARECIGRALLVDPDNMNMRYNLACSLAGQLKDVEGALDLLGPFFATATLGDVSFTQVDSDLDHVRKDPRYVAMFAAAEERLARDAESEAPAAASCAAP